MSTDSPEGEDNLAFRLVRARERAQQERAWYAEHGGDLLGYIEPYGDPGLWYCRGDGGTAIHRADLAAVVRAEATLAALEDQDWLRRCGA
jgi:hypothetical protein